MATLTRARDQHGRLVRTPEQIEHDLRAADLRSKSLSYAQIAAELGVSRQAAQQAVMRGIAELPKDGVEEARRIELAKLDTLEQAAWKVLETHHLVVIQSGPKAGDVVYHPITPDEPLEDDAPVLAAIDRIVKCSERRARLMGLDAPKEAIQYIVTEDMIRQEIRRLEVELDIPDSDVQSIAGELESPRGTPTESGEG